MITQRRCRVTEGSCSYCRKRRLRCDLSHPTCGRCRKDDQECSYSSGIKIKWVGGMATRGKLGPVSPSKTSKSPYPSSPSSPPTSPVQDGELLLYFNKVVIPRFQIPERQTEFAIDAVLQDEALQQAILALSQAHYAINSKSDGASIVLLRKRARQAAIESFRHLLEGGVTSESSAQQLFTVNVLLCILDGIIEPNEELNASMCHLKGGFAILNRWRHTAFRMLQRNGLEPHFLSIFTTMDLVHAMLSGEKPFFEPLSWYMFTNVQTWWGCSAPDDRFLATLKSFAELSILGNLVFSALPAVDTLPVVDRCSSMIERSLSQPDHTFLEQSTSSTNDERNWTTFCAIYSCCAAIYIERALRLKPINNEAVQAATRRGVEMLIDDTLPGMMSHCLIFPILVLGAHCLHSQDRRAILNALSPSSSYLSFGSLSLMADFLQESWRTGDTTQNWWQTFSKVSERAFFF